MTGSRAFRKTNIAVLLLTALLLLPFILGQLGFVLDTDMFDPDMLTLYGFFRLHDPELFPDDYMADYFMRLGMPPGYRLLQYLWSLLFDPMWLHRGLPVVLWCACIPLVYISGRRLGGLANAWATLAIYMCSSIFIFRMTGGMPHAFGFPLTWWVVASLLSGNSRSLALATVTSAAFYPIITPIAGMTLACWLLFPRLAPAIARTAPEARWPWRRKLVALGMVALLTGLMMLPMAMSRTVNGYGDVINVLAERERFPEATNPLAAINPFPYVLISYAMQNSTRLGMDGGQVLTLAIMGILLSGILLHNPCDRRPGSLKPYIYPVALFFLGALLFNYDNAYRFAMYNVPVLITLFLPLALRRLCRTLFPRGMKGPAFIVLVLAYVAAIAQAEPQASGYLFRLEDFQKRALAFVQTLPKDAMIAGWPGDRYGRIVESIPYVARRQALVTWAGHPVFHSGYVLTMRARMNAIVDAYLARDMAPLIALREKFGVDYLVVNEADLAGEEPPYYIEPFNERARGLWKEGQGKSFIVLELVGKAGVYSSDGIHILDLHRL
jgi:hypothetical protein